MLTVHGGKPLQAESLRQALALYSRYQPLRPLLVRDQVAIWVQQPPRLQRILPLGRCTHIDLKLAFHDLISVVSPARATVRMSSFPDEGQANRWFSREELNEGPSAGAGRQPVAKLTTVSWCSLHPGTCRALSSLHDVCCARAGCANISTPCGCMVDSQKQLRRHLDTMRLHGRLAGIYFII